MLLLSFLSNISLSLALVANRASLPSRLGVSTTPVHHQWSATQQQQQFAPSSSSRHLHPFTRDNYHSSNNSKHASNRRLNALSAAATSSSSSPAPSTTIGKRPTILATTILIFLDMKFRSTFLKYSIPFPSSLAGCGTLFASMLLLDAVSDEKWGAGLYKALNPGAMLLAKWLPVFFVPSLVLLPLASGLGDAFEVRFTLSLLSPIVYVIVLL